MGPRQDAGEDKHDADVEHGDVRASMGPRQDAGEDMIPR